MNNCAEIMFSFAVPFLFFLSFGLICLRYCLSNRIATYLTTQDGMHHGVIIPHLFGLVSRTICVFPAVVSAILGAAQQGNMLAVVLIMIPCIGVGIVKYLDIQTSTAFVQGENLVIVKRGKTQSIPLSKIQSVMWRPTDIGFCNCLEIRVNKDVVFDFAQDDYWGLNDLHSILNSALKKSKM